MNLQVIASPSGDIRWVPRARANARLKNWRILPGLRCCPWRAGQLAQAVHTLEIHAA